jgi:hypothetical protein
VLDVRGAVANEVIAMTKQSTKRFDLVIWEKGGGKQALGVELLKPLAIQEV